MGIFDWLFKKKEEISNKSVKEFDPVSNQDFEIVKVNKKIIRVRCDVCNHKKAKMNPRGEIICRKCRSFIGRSA